MPTFHGSITYVPPEPITAAAEKNCAAKKASVVTRVSQPMMFAHPQQKETRTLHFSEQREYVKWYCLQHG